MSGPLTIALLGVAQPQQPRLARLLTVPHRFLTPSAERQRVDALISLRFGPEEAARFAPRLLHLPGAGADAVELELLPPGSIVCNVFEHEIPVAEYVMTAILSHATQYVEMVREFDSANFGKLHASRRYHCEIHGKTLGLIGYGHIGSLVAQRARAFGMRVHAVSRSGNAPGADRADTAANLHAMLREADFVVIACPLTEETRGLIGRAEFQAMKRTAVLINVGRAAVVDEEALHDALAHRRIGGATLDVWYQYPSTASAQTTPARFPFEQLPHVHCTPHSCAWTEEMLERRFTLIAGNLGRLYAGEPLHNVIHPVPA